jgi:hypothetical protein
LKYRRRHPRPSRIGKEAALSIPPYSSPGFGRPAYPQYRENREPGLVLIFSILSCGLYYFYWLYKASDESQSFLGEPDTAPGVEVLLSLITCGIYILFWDYKFAKKMIRMQEAVGVRVVDNTVLYLALDILGLGIITPLIEQAHLNEVWAAESAIARSSGG